MRSRRPTSNQSRSFTRERRNKRAVIGGLVVVCISTWLFSLARLTQIQALTIENIEISGAEPAVADTLRATVLESLQGKNFGIFARSGTIDYPQADIVRRVKAASPGIDSVSVKRSGLNGLTISVQEKKPQAIVCASLPDFSGNDDGCYLADEDGFIFKQASSSDDISRLERERYYIPDAALGSYATSTAQFKLLESVYSAAKASGIDVQGMLIKDAGEYELYARNPGAINTASSTDNDTAVIYLNDAGRINDEIANLVSFWTRMTDTARTKGETLRFDYIDPRYAPNVFYRLVK